MKIEIGKKGDLGDIIATPGVFILIILMGAAYLVLAGAISIKGPSISQTPYLDFTTQKFILSEIELNDNEKTTITILELIYLKAETNTDLYLLEIREQRNELDENQKRKLILLREISSEFENILEKELTNHPELSKEEICVAVFSKTISETGLKSFAGKISSGKIQEITGEIILNRKMSFVSLNTPQNYHYIGDCKELTITPNRGDNIK